MLRRGLFWILFCIGSSVAIAQNQTPAGTLNLPRVDTSQGPGLGSLQQSGRETINLGMSSVSAFLPIVDLPQRGGRSLRLGYITSNNTWAVKETSVTYNQYGTASGSNPQNWWLETYATLNWQQAYTGPFVGGALHLNLPTLQADVMYMGVTQTGSGSSTVFYPSYCYTGWTFSDWSGASHSFNGFRDCDKQYGNFTSNFWTATTEATDDSGYRIDLTSSSDPKIVGLDGTVYHFPNYTAPAASYVSLGAYSKPFSSIGDPNGNTMSFNPSSRVLTDTMGRAIQYNADGGISWPYQSSPGASPSTATVTLSQSNSGSTVPFDMTRSPSCYAKSPGSYMGGAQAAGYSGPSVQGPYAPTVYSSNTTTLTLADGSYYALTYDANNLLTTLRYPSGGYHRYDYGVTSGTSGEDDGDMICSRPRIVMLAKHECTQANGSCSQSPAATTTNCQAGAVSGGEATTCYTSGSASSSGSVPLNVVSPLNEITAYTFTLANQQPASAPGVPGHFFAPMETSHAIYAANSSRLLQKVDTTLVTPSNCPVVTNSYGSANDGEWCGQAPGSTKTTVFDAQGNATGVAEHDVSLQYPGLITSTQDLDFNGKVVRSSNYAYESGGIYGVSPSGGLYHILDHVQNSTSSETATNKSVSTTHTYDAVGNLVQIDTSATNSAGTTVKASRNSYGDISGYADAAQVGGQHGGSTQVGYDPQSISGCPAAAGPGAPTLITNALSQSTRYAYDAAGKLSCVQDANGQITRFSHDALGRMTEIDSPDGGVTTASYTSAAPFTMSESIAQGPSTSVVMDGLGRTSQSTLAAPEGTICTETFYDADGNTSAVNHPQLGCSGSVVAGVAVQTTHDALGRKLVQTNEDGTTVQWGYSGTTTSTTDEAGHTTTQVVDALGRPIHVGEATGTSTDYTYDGFGNLTAVSQWGVSGDTSRQRSFAYDGLSRLLISNNPETGTVCYGTWSGGSVGSGTCGNGYDLNGDLLAKTDARGLGVLFGYDALNRVTNKRYFGPGYVDGAIKQFFYDGANASGALAVQANSNLAGRLSMARSWAPYGNNNYDEYFAYGSTGLLSRQTNVAQSESGSGGHTASVTYDQAGHPHSLTYPSGRVLTYGYDSAGRASTITDANGTTYLSSASYFPNGTPNVTISPNVIAQQNTINNRLQICETTYGNQYGTLMDRQYFFGTNNSAGTQCNPVAGNNGNIFHVMDGLNVMNSQHYSYDALNRLTQFNGSSPAGAVRQQSFGYDSFGNLTQATGSTSLAASSVYGSNNRYLPNQFQCTGINGETGGYDAAGNLLCTGVQNSTAQAYGYNEESQIVTTSVQQNSNGYHQRALYSFDSSGQRIRADQFDPASGNETGWREYTYLNGQVLAEKDNTGAWTDQVYVHGRKLAQINPTVPRVHVRAQHSQAGCASSFVQSGLGGYQYQIKAKDTLFFDQQTSGANGGLVLIPYNAPFQPFIAANTFGSVQHRSFDLSSIAGETVNGFWPMMGYTDAGASEMYMSNVTIVSADGTVTPIFNGQSVSYGGLSDTCSGSTGTMAVEQSALPETRYFAADQVGTAQMELASGGWPLWRGEFTLFGQELDTLPTYFSNAATNGSSNRYRYTGKERDAESGLDNFGPRYYGSTMGRFLSPDDFGGHLEDPQTLNKYAYAGNNPLRYTDPSGHDFWQSCNEAGKTCGNQNIGTGTDGKPINQLVSGTTDANGKFTATVITSASLGQSGSGNTANVDGTGVHITTGAGTDKQQSGQGIFIAGTASADIKGTGGGWNQFNFHIDGNDVAHGGLTTGTATYLGQGGHQGMMNTLNGMMSGDNGPFQYPGEDHYNGFHPGATNVRFSPGDYPEILNYGPSPHFPVPGTGTSVPNFHIDSGTGPFHVICAKTGYGCY